MRPRSAPSLFFYSHIFELLKFGELLYDGDRTMADHLRKYEALYVLSSRLYCTAQMELMAFLLSLYECSN